MLIYIIFLLGIICGGFNMAIAMKNVTAFWSLLFLWCFWRIFDTVIVAFFIPQIHSTHCLIHTFARYPRFLYTIKLLQSSRYLTTSSRRILNGGYVCILAILKYQQVWFSNRCEKCLLLTYIWDTLIPKLLSTVLT